MTVNTYTYWASMSDKAIVAAIGEYIKHIRLNQNTTQAQLASAAGVSRWTLTQIEKGEAITMLSLIQILRALNQLHLFDGFRIVQEISPIELVKLEQKKRLRARNKSNKNKVQSDW
jgi:transcriptional regulator with XRE-family HTH domain